MSKNSVLVLILSVFVVITTIGQNPINEDFENKTVGFNVVNDGYVLSKKSSYSGTVTATVNQSGSNKFVRMIGSPNGSAGMQITKTITVEGGKTYTFWMDSKGPFKRQLRVLSSSDEMLQASADYKPETTSESNAWYTMTISFTVPTGVSSIKIAFHHYWSGTIDLDNIKVFEAQRQTEYYLSDSGSDSNDGTINSPWKSLSKISATTLFPGDKVYFNRGDTFLGKYTINGSGSEVNPILITSYGSGDKPILDGAVGASAGGDHEEAIYIENQDNITIDGLEIKNDRTVSRSGVNDEFSFGISIHNSSDEIMENFIFRNLTVRDVFAVEPILDRDSFDAIQVSGIRFTCARNTVAGKEKNIQNILIEDSYFTNLQRLGIQFKHSGGSTGVGDDAINSNKDITVRNNTFYYNGGTAVLPNRTYNCLIENNVFDHPGADTDPRMPARGSSVWNINCTNTVVQYNMCISTRGYLDSYGIHIDLRNTNTFVQYNYMYDCEGGFVEILAGNVNAVYRFNVDVNSGFRVSNWNNASSTIYVYSDRWKEANQAALDLCDGVYIHNNTIVVNKGTKDNGDPYTTAVTSDAKNTYIYNNIFSSTNNAGIGKRNYAMRDNSSTLLITNNLFEGTVLPDFVNADVNRKTGSSYFTTSGKDKYGYQVYENSPAVNNGTAIQSPVLPGAGTGVFANVPAYPNVDFFGNPVDLSSGTPNIGAYNGKTNAVLNTNNFELNNTDSWIVYPNNDYSVLQISNTSNQNDNIIKVQLYNIKGQLITSENLDKQISNNHYELNIPASISNGIYILNINNNGKNHSRKMILQK